MCDPKKAVDDLTNILAVGALLGPAGATAVAGAGVVDEAVLKPQRDALDLQRQANADNRQAATKQADLADQANNRANARSPDIAGLFSKNALDAKGGQSGTMLTGPQGIDPNTLLLGRKTLLGG